MSSVNPAPGKHRILISAVLLKRDDHVLDLEGAEDKKHVAGLKDYTTGDRYTVNCLFDFMTGTVDELAEEFRQKLGNAVELTKGLT